MLAYLIPECLVSICPIIIRAADIDMQPTGITGTVSSSSSCSSSLCTYFLCSSSFCSSSSHLFIRQSDIDMWGGITLHKHPPDQNQVSQLKPSDIDMHSILTTVFSAQFSQNSILYVFLPNLAPSPLSVFHHILSFDYGTNIEERMLRNKDVE